MSICQTCGGEIPSRSKIILGWMIILCNFIMLGVFVYYGMIRGLLYMMIVPIGALIGCYFLFIVDIKRSMHECNKGDDEHYKNIE